MISVIVCTRNRAESLRRTLDSLHAMAMPPTLAWEVVVVDNGSGDHTRSVTEETARATGMPVRYLLETEPGLSRARNAGARAARGEVVAFTDDDCRVDARWLAQIDAEFGADTSLAVLGGRVELYDPSDQPVSVRRQRERTHVTSLAQIATFMIGCNMACRRRLLYDVGLFDVRFGRAPGSRQRRTGISCIGRGGREPGSSSRPRCWSSMTMVGAAWLRWSRPGSRMLSVDGHSTASTYRHSISKRCGRRRTSFAGYWATSFGAAGRPGRWCPSPGA